MNATALSTKSATIDDASRDRAGMAWVVGSGLYKATACDSGKRWCFTCERRLSLARSLGGSGEVARDRSRAYCASATDCGHSIGAAETGAPVLLPSLAEVVAVVDVVVLVLVLVAGEASHSCPCCSCLLGRLLPMRLGTEARGLGHTARSSSLMPTGSRPFGVPACVRACVRISRVSAGDTGRRHPGVWCGADRHRYPSL